MAFKNRLTAREVETADQRRSRRLGPMAKVTPRQAGQSWLLRYRFDGKARQLGLGSALTTSLAEARKRAQEARDLIARGIDPRERRDVAKAERMASVAKRKTFEQCFRDYIETHRAEWKSAKHAAQWDASVKHTTALNPLDVSTIEKAHVLGVLKPIWLEKTETASRIRSRIEMVLDYATNAGFRQGDNPARLEGLKGLLPAKAKIATKEHHAALPYAELPGFTAELRERQGMASRALEFTILCAARVGEVLGARWSEVDLNAKTWTISAARMKGNVDTSFHSRRAPSLSSKACRARALQRRGSFRASEAALPSRRIRDALLALRPARRTASGRRFVIGAATRPPSRARSQRPRSRTRSAIRSRLLIGAGRLEKRRKLMAHGPHTASGPSGAGEVVSLRGRRYEPVEVKKRADRFDRCRPSTGRLAGACVGCSPRRRQGSANARGLGGEGPACREDASWDCFRKIGDGMHTNDVVA